MAEYEARENRFNDSLAGRVGGFLKSVSLADGEARMQDVGIIQEIAKMPNVEFEQKIQMITQERPMLYKSSIPALAAVESRPLLAESVDLEMSMNVSASTTEETSKDKSVDSDTQIAAEASGRIGLFKIGIKTQQGIKASNSNHSSRKRQSDYSSTTDMKLHMTRHPIAEGLAKAIDTQNAILQAAAEADLALVKANIDRSINAVEEPPVLPEATSDSEAVGQQSDAG